jgi:hypothetical protein
VAFCRTYEDFEWVALTVAAERSLDPEGKAALKEWYDAAFERAFQSGSCDWPSTCDWPEWERILGRRNPLHEIEVVRIPIKLKKAAIPVDLRWEVFERDGFTCKKCGTRRRLTIDHIVAESKGGPTTLGNLQTLCHSCNSRKGAK